MIVIIFVIVFLNVAVFGVPHSDVVVPTCITDVNVVVYVFVVF